jgi:hypothetical protein
MSATAYSLYYHLHSISDDHLLHHNLRIGHNVVSSRHLVWLMVDSNYKDIFIILTFSHDEMKYITPKTWREGYTKLQEWSQQSFVSNLLIFSNWDFLKKLAHSIYGRGSVLDDPRFRIPATASVFRPLQNFQTGSGAHTASWLVCTARFQGGWSGRGVRLTTHVYRLTRWWCPVQSFR